MHANHVQHFIYHTYIYNQLKWKHAYKTSYLNDDNDNHIYIACEDLEALILEKPAHISSINLQVECAPLRCCARPRPAVRTGGAAKQEIDHHQYQQQPNILLLRVTL